MYKIKDKIPKFQFYQGENHSEKKSRFKKENIDENLFHRLKTVNFNLT